VTKIFYGVVTFTSRSALSRCSVLITARLTAESWLVDLRQDKLSVRNRLSTIHQSRQGVQM